jgi:PAS domain S-box-containing protein
MHLHYNPYLVPLTTAATISVVLALFAWRRRPAPGLTSFILLVLSVVEWSLGYALELGSVNLTAKVFWSQVKYLGVAVAPTAFFTFTLQYTGRPQWLKPRNIALLTIEPIITLLLVWTNHLHGLIWSTIEMETIAGVSMRVSTLGAWFWLNVVYSYILIFLGTILLAKFIIRSPHFYREQVGTVLTGVIAPWVGNGLNIFHLNPFPNLDLTPFAFTLTGICLSWSFFRLRLLDIVPAARDAVIESMNDVVMVLDTQNRIVDLNPAAEHAFRCSKSKVIGQPATQMLTNWPELTQHHRNAAETHSEIVLGEGEAQRYFDLRISPLNDRNRRLTGRLFVSRDVTERKQAEEILQKAHDELEKRIKERTAELLRANEQLRREIGERVRAEQELKETLKLIGRAKREWESTADSLPQLIFLLDSQGFILRTNRTIERWNLGQVTQIKGRRTHELIHPCCIGSNCYFEAFWQQAWKELTSGQSAEYEVEDMMLKRYIHVQARPISLSKYRKDEEIESFAVVVISDITERKRAEKEMNALQEQLRQAQKMEAMGRLAGGVAHDFNNLLTVIKGYSQMSLSQIRKDDPLKENLEEIQKASERAAGLTRQLLAFSRHQVMEMKVLDLNTLLRDLGKMLRRIIGEDIELVTLLAEDLGKIKADPGQIEQVIINLAINARDAMPSVGKLIIETANAELDEGDARSHIGMTPGSYVKLAVSDTGCGIPPEIKERIFEPFFTTKEIGKGTGLGLSTVYGIVKQSGANILIYSEPGQGTTFKIFLPRIQEETGPLASQGELDTLPLGKETVLLVEDEPMVLGMVARILLKQGYFIIEATNGDEALRLAQERAEEKIHLLLTDMVMPRMGGKELAHQLRVARPDIKVLFTSGYTYQTFIHQGVLDPGTGFLEKPFSPTALVQKVREVLDR